MSSCSGTACIRPICTETCRAWWKPTHACCATTPAHISARSTECAEHGHEAPEALREAGARVAPSHLEAPVIPMSLVGVRVEVPSNQPIVLLREHDGQRYLPIHIG